MSHTWHKIAVGRVCLNCSVAQATDEFDDSKPCTDDKPYDVKRARLPRER